LKCTECGTGYIPVVIESRPFKHKESPALYIGLGIGGAVLLVALAIAFDIVSFWIVWALVIAALLGGIYLRLARK